MKGSRGATLLDRGGNSDEGRSDHVGLGLEEIEVFSSTSRGPFEDREKAMALSSCMSREIDDAVALPMTACSQVRTNFPEGKSGRCEGGNKMDHPATFSPRLSLSEKKEGCERGEKTGTGEVLNLAGSSVVGAMTVLEPMLKTYMVDWRSKAQSTGEVFPLPTNIDYLQGLGVVPVELLMMLKVVCMGLNSYAGVSMHSEYKPTAAQARLLKELSRELTEVASWSETFEDVSWENIFQTKSVDYMGDEVATARHTSWQNLSPAIPQEVGKVELHELVDEGCKDYVLNFEDYLVDPSTMTYTAPPKVMVADDEWEGVCAGLLESGICSLMPETELYHVENKPVLNGMFGVSKHEFVDNCEVHRLIMNLIPVNNLCRSFQRDVATLPAWSSCGPLYLMPSEQLLISSEDVRCFFYIFKVPHQWRKFLGFNKVVPASFHPERQGRRYLVSNVLPMGFKNSVTIAQAVHRCIVRKASQQRENILLGQSELRKDRPFFLVSQMHRVYLDNFDELEKADSKLAEAIKGTASPGILALRAEYEHWGIPRHPKKAVERSGVAEVQGAIVNGIAGCAYPKPSKILKYTQLALLTVAVGRCSQREMQVVARGLSLCCHVPPIWTFIEKFKEYPPVIRLEIPPVVCLEILRFVSLIPLTSGPSRTRKSPQAMPPRRVAASTGLTNNGYLAVSCPVRGDLAELNDMTQILGRSV